MKALVTGGGGFLGRRIVELLLEQGHTVRFCARGRYPEVEDLGAEGLRVDLVDAGAVREAVAGMDAVFHVAAKAGYWGDPEAFAQINVGGTRNVIDACRQAGVPKLVYTSTPSVIGYGHDAEGIGEAPYPERWESAYARTKAMAEQAVRAANGPGLATVALRPHLIIGPREPNMLPRVMERARAGRLRIIGDGTNQVDITYIDNAAWAHLDAERALTDSDAPCAGGAYFISNGEPTSLWPWINDFLARVGVPRIDRHVSVGSAVRIGAVMEWLWRTFRLGGEPPMTRFVALAMSRAHWYDMGPAERDLGYHVRVGLADGTDRAVAWFAEPTARTGSSDPARAPAPRG